MERTGFPSMAEAHRARRAALGPTPGCPACSLSGVWGHGRKHNAECRIQRAAWEAEQRGADVQGEVQQMRKRIKQEIVAPEVRKSTDLMVPGAAASSGSTMQEPEESRGSSPKRPGDDTELMESPAKSYRLPDDPPTY
eukprot:5680624-Amphidinium_carterae.1